MKRIVTSLNSFQSFIRFQIRRNPGFLISRSLDEGGKNYEPKFELVAICNLFCDHFPKLVNATHLEPRLVTTPCATSGLGSVTVTQQPTLVEGAVPHARKTAGIPQQDCSAVKV